MGAKYGNVEVVKLLLKDERVDVGLVDNQGRSATHSSLSKTKKKTKWTKKIKQDLRTRGCMVVYNQRRSTPLPSHSIPGQCKESLALPTSIAPMRLSWRSSSW